jgi:hypothetical protein
MAGYCMKVNIKTEVCKMRNRRGSSSSRQTSTKLRKRVGGGGPTELLTNRNLQITLLFLVTVVTKWLHVNMRCIQDSIFSN